ncbi:MAG: hypothetical protein QXS91_02105, partial [Candidatus Anstonellales archaeon]
RKTLKRIESLLEAQEERLKELNERLVESDEEKVELEITDETGAKTTIQISRRILETIKYAGELANMDYESIKEEMHLLKDEIKKLLGDNKNNENAQILAFVHLIEEAIDKLALNIAVEYEGQDDKGQQMFKIRDEFKKDFNWEALKEVISAIVSAELGYNVTIENADLGKVLKHVEEVFLDLEAYNIKIVEKEGSYEVLKAKKAGSHVEISSSTESGVIKNVELENSQFSMKADTSSLYEKALSVIPEETRNAIGDDNAIKIVETLVQVYKKSFSK